MAFITRPVSPPVLVSVGAAMLPPMTAAAPPTVSFVTTVGTVPPVAGMLAAGSLTASTTGAATVIGTVAESQLVGTAREQIWYVAL